MLSYCEYNGTGYSLDAITANQRQLLYEISLLGIIYLPSNSSKFFYPTRVAIEMIMYTNKQTLIMSNTNTMNLLTNNTLPSNLNNSRMSIIVETNYQVVAYIFNELQFRMLQLFVDIHAKLPNMVLGKLTRDKSRKAFSMGISATQIIEFLLIHTHPNVHLKKEKNNNKNNKNNHNHKNNLQLEDSILLPENVIDQIVLWENEANRIQAQDVIIIDMYEDINKHLQNKNFKSIEIYNKLCKFITSRNLYVWKIPDKPIFAISFDDFPAIQQYSISLGFT